MSNMERTAVLRGEEGHAIFECFTELVSGDGTATKPPWRGHRDPTLHFFPLTAPSANAAGSGRASAASFAAFFAPSSCIILTVCVMTPPPIPIAGM